MTEHRFAPDPHTRALLELMAAKDAPSYADLTPEGARQLARDSGKASDVAPPDVAVVDNRTIPGPGGPIPIRVYRGDADATGPHPTLLYFHGGGFVVGDLDTHDPLCRSLALASGCQVVSVDYRLAPEHRYPAAVEDALAAYAWCFDAGPDEIGIDADRLAVGGDSAGGTLAAVVAQTARDDGRRLRAQVLFYPVVDMSRTQASYREFADMAPIESHVLDWFWGHYFDGQPSPEVIAHPWASPLNAERLAGTAPAFVLTAGLDPLRDEGEDYARRLSSEGVETMYVCATGTIHAFLRMGRYVPAAQDAVATAAAFLAPRMV